MESKSHAPCNVNLNTIYCKVGATQITDTTPKKCLSVLVDEHLCLTLPFVIKCTCILVTSALIRNSIKVAHEGMLQVNFECEIHY